MRLGAEIARGLFRQPDSFALDNIVSREQKWSRGERSQGTTSARLRVAELMQNKYQQ